MGALSLVTKGMLCRHDVNVIVQSGSGGAGLRKEEELPKPLIKVTKFQMTEEKSKITDENVQVTSLKLVLDDKSRTN